MPSYPIPLLSTPKSPIPQYYGQDSREIAQLPRLASPRRSRPDPQVWSARPALTAFARSRSNDPSPPRSGRGVKHWPGLHPGSPRPATFARTRPLARPRKGKKKESFNSQRNPTFTRSLHPNPEKTGEGKGATNPSPSRIIVEIGCCCFSAWQRTRLSPA